MELQLSNVLLAGCDWKVCISCHQEFYDSVLSNETICPSCVAFDMKRQNEFRTIPYHSNIRPKKEKISENLRWEIWERDNFTCKKCGSHRRLTVDHIYPESKGGKLNPENLQTLCKSCNSKKGTK